MSTRHTQTQSQAQPPLHDPKAMAKALRRALAGRIELTHGESLECVAQQLGWRDWNTLAARLDRPVLRVPDGWIVSGSHPEYYEMGVDDTRGDNDTRSGNGGAGGSAALIRSRPAVLDLHPSDRPGGFGTLMQSIDAKRYAGRRVRLAAQLRTRDVTGAGTMWLRVDGDGRNALVFDNMEQRERDGALVGTQGWQDRTIVLDVPDEARSLHFGFFLRGEGWVWARRFKLDEADASEPTTDAPPVHNAAPTNLDFAAAG